MKRRSSQQGGSRTPNRYLEGVRKRATWIILVGQFIIVMNSIGKLAEPRKFVCKPNFYHGTMECLETYVNP